MSLQQDLTNFHKYKSGQAAATEEMKHPDFDLFAAIKSFEDDPADSSFQHGFLNALRRGGM